MTTEEYVHQLNVLNFTRQLADARHEPERDLLMLLLAAEQAHAITRGWMPILNPDAGHKVLNTDFYTRGPPRALGDAAA